jgi:DNA invertase Pin-like site-specific DNA recombinase
VAVEIAFQSPKRLERIRSPENKERQAALTRQRFANGEQTPPAYIQKTRVDGEPYFGLGDDDVLSILTDRRSYTTIAQEFRISVASVSNIKNGKTYKHVPRTDVFFRKPGGSIGAENRRPRRLSDAQIRAICADTRPTIEIAADYNISFSMVGQIKHRKVYAHVAVSETHIPIRRELSGKDHPRSRAVSTPRGIFPTLTSAARHYGISNAAATIWSQQGKNGWRLVTPE